MSKRVVITGVGLVNAVGNDTATVWRSLCEGRSGVATIASFDTAPFTTKFGAEVHDFDAAQYMDKKEVRRNDPFVHYALGAAKQALDDSGLTITDENADDIGVIIGSGIGGMRTAHEQFRVLFEKGPDRVSPFFITMYITDIAAGFVSIQLGARGPNFATVSACSTGAHAIGEAAEMIRRGDAVAMFAGGAEAGITPIGLAAFGNMKALSRRNDEPAKASRPFDKERDGFVMGDGAGILLLEDEEHARARGARVYAELLSYAGTADAHHITEPAPMGEGLTRAIRRALAKGGVNPDDVQYINAHGTATGLNDLHESQAIRTVFGEAPKLAISSTKSMIGHTLGAAGGIEAGVTALSIYHGVITPTINLENPDPACGNLDYTPNQARESRIQIALSNSMGFGGHNAVLAFRRYA
jgi:3-oxoacyl-[acyl-carrier-protein] synthase II